MDSSGGALGRITEARDLSAPFESRRDSVLCVGRRCPLRPPPQCQGCAAVAWLRSAKTNGCSDLKSGRCGRDCLNLAGPRAAPLSASVRFLVRRPGAAPQDVRCGRVSEIARKRIGGVPPLPVGCHGEGIPGPRRSEREEPEGHSQTKLALGMIAGIVAVPAVLATPLALAGIAYLKRDSRTVPAWRWVPVRTRYLGKVLGEVVETPRRSRACTAWHSAQQQGTISR